MYQYRTEENIHTDEVCSFVETRLQKQQTTTSINMDLSHQQQVLTITHNIYTQVYCPQHVHTHTHTHTPYPHSCWGRFTKSDHSTRNVYTHSSTRTHTLSLLHQSHSQNLITSHTQYMHIECEHTHAPAGADSQNHITSIHNVYTHIHMCTDTHARTHTHTLPHLHQRHSQNLTTSTHTMYIHPYAHACKHTHLRYPHSIRGIHKIESLVHTHRHIFTHSHTHTQALPLLQQEQTHKIKSPVYTYTMYAHITHSHKYTLPPLQQGQIHKIVFGWQHEGWWQVWNPSKVRWQCVLGHSFPSLFAAVVTAFFAFGASGQPIVQFADNHWCTVTAPCPLAPFVVCTCTQCTLS